jgi:hypothetical protein
MAVNQVKLSSALVLKVKTGVDSSGNDVFKNIALKKVKTAAADQDVFDVAQGFKNVLKDSVTGIMKQDVNELVSA